MSQIHERLSKFLKSVGLGIEYMVKLKCKEVNICEMEG